MPQFDYNLFFPILIGLIVYLIFIYSFLINFFFPIMFKLIYIKKLKFIWFNYNILVQSLIINRYKHYFKIILQISIIYFWNVMFYSSMKI